MEQYIEIKAANPDCLLFYRMGDFYELFFEDAEIAARALGIVLTKRGKHLGRDIPMCGVPVHRSDEYLHRLIAMGHRVAVCEQLEDPAEARKRGGKSVVRRDVIRLVTPGTLTEDTLLDARRNNYLLAIARARASAGEESRFAIAWIDISTGEFRIAECDRTAVAADIARLEPGEIIVSDALYGDSEFAPYLRSLPAVTPLTRDVFDGASAERRLAGYFGLSTTEGFGALSRLELTAAAACITYVERTQLGQRPPLSPPVREPQGATLLIDQATRSNLELMRTLSGERRGSLLAAIDRSVTAAGSRLLAQRLAAPLTDAGAIGRRHDAVAFFVTSAGARADIRERLKAAPDLARSLARLVVGRGGPRDLAAMRDGVTAAADLAAELEKFPALAAELAQAMQSLRRPDPAIAAELAAALADELPHLKRDGGFVRAGYDAALDEARALRDESRRVIAALQGRYADTTAVRTLKIRHNNVLGYFVEVTAQHGDKLMAPPDARRPGALHHHRTWCTRSQDRQRRRPRARDRARELRQARRHRDGGIRRHQGCRRRACHPRCRHRLGAIGGRAPLRAAGNRRLARFHRRGWTPSGRGAGSRRRRRTVRRQRLRPLAAPAGAARPHLPADWAEHGGQVHLPAPERAHCHPCADGKLRPRAPRQDRRRRSAVLPRRGSRRHRAWAFDLHGRDGGDRGHPQSGGRARARHSG
jgi:DNA mismatch repair protein MutS